MGMPGSQILGGLSEITEQRPDMIPSSRPPAARNPAETVQAAQNPPLSFYNQFKIHPAGGKKKPNT